jgi:hypothetical protein
MSEALSDSAAVAVGGVVLTAWGIIAVILGAVVWTDFHGAARWGVRMARLSRDVDPEDAEDSLNSYRYMAGAFGILGVVIIVFGLILLTRSTV